MKAHPENGIVKELLKAAEGVNNHAECVGLVTRIEADMSNLSVADLAYAIRCVRYDDVFPSKDEAESFISKATERLTFLMNEKPDEEIVAMAIEMSEGDGHHALAALCGAALDNSPLFWKLSKIYDQVTRTSESL